MMSMKDEWKGEGLPKYLTKQEVEEFLKVAYNYAYLHGIAFECMFLTGIRSAELYNLKTGDVDFENRVMRVNHGKGGKDRFIPITQGFLDKLRIYLEEREDLNPQHRIFPLSEALQRKYCERYRRLLSYSWKDLPHPHTLRHSFAVHFLKTAQTKHMHQALEALRRILGHASLSTTAIYLNFLYEDIREVYDGVFSE